MCFQSVPSIWRCLYIYLPKSAPAPLVASWGNPRRDLWSERNPPHRSTPCRKSSRVGWGCNWQFLHWSILRSRNCIQPRISMYPCLCAFWTCVPLIQSFVHSFIHSFVHSSFVCSFTHSCICLYAAFDSKKMMCISVYISIYIYDVFLEIYIYIYVDFL